MLNQRVSLSFLYVFYPLERILRPFSNVSNLSRSLAQDVI